MSWATEIKVRAVRKAGEMLAESKKNGARDAGGRGRRIESRDATQIPTLQQIGISRDKSSRWQKMAKMPQETFENILAEPAVVPSTSMLVAAVGERFRSACELDQTPRITGK